MASITMQRDLILTLKRETLLNVGILSKLQPMESELTRLLKENTLEKPTQNLFNHLSHYLVSIIDPAVPLPWPLYDTKTERTYRNELAVFISSYSQKGLLAPVVSSYLVNPGSYKVVLLIFQLSQLAVQRLLLKKMNKESQKKLFNDMTEKYKSKAEEGFIESIEKETEIMLSKFSNYLRKREAMEKLAEKLRSHISHMEDRLEKSNAQKLIDNLVDGYLKKHQLANETKNEILQIKNIRKPAKYFDKWLEHFDAEMNKIESNWDANMSPFLKISQTTLENTSTLIARQTGEADKNTFTVEYNPKTDVIRTDELQKQVNSQQKYVLKNIVKDDKLNFPNLIRGFLISICYILKNTEISDEIYRFNEYLKNGHGNYVEIVSAMRILMERVWNADDRIQIPQDTFTSFVSNQEMSEIPPLPDLSDIKMNREYHHQVIFDAFTPLNLNKHQFNLRKHKTGLFTKSLPKMFATPFHTGPRDDFLRSIIACRVSSYDQMNITQNSNMTIAQVARANETVAECTSGFTKQQITRLLSTKKSSSSKKFKNKMKRPDIKVIKGGLFNESTISNESLALFRSHSSPNLYENREKVFRSNLKSRKLSIMKEDSPSLLEVSGIAALERDSNHSTPQGILSLESSRKLMDAASLPSLAGTPTSDMSSDGNELIKEIVFKQPLIIPKRRSKEKEDPIAMLPQRKSRIPQRQKEEPKVLPGWNNLEQPQRKSNDYAEVNTRKSLEEFEKEEAKIETPKNREHAVTKTNSLEKIINRFKKVRASILPTEVRDDENEFKTIYEEKENMNTVNVDVFTANRNLLPDLLSPSCSIITQSTDYDNLLYFDSNDDKKPRKPRESLGAALGVDHTFLDQFDLID